MPLKHSTETILIVILGIVMLAAGVLTASLPSLPLGAGPWGIAFLLAVLYPLILYPFLRDNRADNVFRLMHWGPAALLGLWFVLAILELIFPAFFVLRRVLVWGFCLIAVAALFVMLVAFCLRVLREGGKRVSILAAILGIFLVLAFVGEWFGWPGLISRDLWSGKPAVTGTGAVASSSSTTSSSSSMSSSTSSRTSSSVVSVSSSSATTSSSRPSSSSSAVSAGSSSSAAVEDEQGWFDWLFGWIWNDDGSSGSSSSSSVSSSSSSSRTSSSSSVSSPASSVSTTSSSRSSSSSSSSLPRIGSSSSSTPPHLPSSGPAVGELLLLLAAGYTGLLHIRAKKRA